MDSLDDGRGRKKVTRFEVGCVMLVLIGMAWILVPVFSRWNEYWRMQLCDNSLKELATALQLYWNDYDGTIPSSALRQPKTDVWNPEESAKFCFEYGPVSPSSPLKPQDAHWLQILWPHMRNKDIAWCPDDPNRPRKTGFWKIEPKPEDMASYFYKPAIDRAWFGVPGKEGMTYYRNEEDFQHIEDQMVFFEHTGWHWGDERKGCRDGVTLLAAFLDGHSRAVRLKDAVNCDLPGNSSGLALLMSKPGEPLWFNTMDAGKGKNVSKKAIWFDPGKCFDDLP